MGNADHADIVHCRMRAELIVHLARVDLESTSQDRFATATDDPHVSVLTEDAEITGEKKAFRRERAPGLSWCTGVAQHDVRHVPPLPTVRHPHRQDA